MKKEKNFIYEKWWFWVCIAIVCFIVIGMIEYFNNTITINKILQEPLDKEITEGKLTYYVSNNWINKEDSKENDKYILKQLLNNSLKELSRNDVDSRDVMEKLVSNALELGILDKDNIIKNNNSKSL